ncbi:hypothetical protein BDN72DRAFT_829631 [Pluteus cervinus]|uniref:Uncharacterized protein n=1 Tax=Pluteus cervinus TaxID=181527 RepID=A0ACD2ZY59_9AGAR|nr:hypothetical protein BDN72DRAFT_829631 [Pluteus cervinus]
MALNPPPFPTGGLAQSQSRTRPDFNSVVNMAPSKEPLTKEEIIEAATIAVNIISDLGLNCYLFGSTAMMLYGPQHRTPRDVDIAVLADEFEDVEDVKKRIVLRSNRFVLRASKIPENEYKILFFKVPRPRVGPNQRRRQNGPRKECKIDILLPGTIGLPRIPFDSLDWRRTLPLAPLKTLILLKLFGWYEHRFDEEQRMRDKVPRDTLDIFQLLTLNVDHPEIMATGGDWCSETLLEAAKYWVCDFIGQKPSTIADWRLLGFLIKKEVHPLPSQGRIAQWIATAEVF